MNEVARRRLGSAEWILPSVGSDQRAQVREFLAGAAEQSILLPFPSGDERGGAPIRVSRLLLGAGQIVLLAEPAERTDGDALGMLGSVGQSLVRDYFRLLRRSRALERRRRRSGRSAAAIWTGQLEQLRAGIARELHVGAGQALAGIRLHLELVRNALTEPPDTVRSSLERIGLLAEEALAQVRAVSHRLNPPEWQQLTLRDALENLWASSGIPQKYDAALHLAPLPAEPALESRIAIYRAAQEAISNVIRHSGCTRVSLTLEGSGGRLRLTVEDNGRGFDAAGLLSAKPRPGEGIGLRAMRDQIRGLHGEFAVESAAKGTKLSVSLPR
ncbi:MAG: histidine kinase [Acidobacteria bacterium]|nr:histidine kinase [Acidobacteriota bacterium]